MLALAGLVISVYVDQHIMHVVHFYTENRFVFDQDFITKKCYKKKKSSRKMETCWDKRNVDYEDDTKRSAPVFRALERK